MSYIYSRALVEASLAASCSAGAPSAPSSASPAQPPSSSSARTMDAWIPSPCGMTFAPSTDARGEELLMSFRAGFRARTSATAGPRLESKAPGAGSGDRWPESLARFDHATSSWRTSQRCLVEGWGTFSDPWPRWGSMRDGECWELPMSVGSSRGSGYGLWPTLKASDGDQYSRNSAYFKRRRLIAPDLPVIVGLSTPPTPMGFYGRLNPAWTEWLMGWPIGWTESGQSAMAKTREWLQQHGKS